MFRNSCSRCFPLKAFPPGPSIVHRYSHSLAVETTRPDASSVQSNQSSSAIQDSSNRFADHLNGVFPQLNFPPELARRLLTHGSHVQLAAVHGHNARFSFMGRRILETYLFLFLHSVSRAGPHHDYQLIASRALNTYILGEHIAPRWSLGHALCWAPTVSSETVHASLKNSKKKPAEALDADAELDIALATNPRIIKSVGLYKVMGDTVQAVMGGIYHQFGGSIAHRIFHTRVLPHILLAGRVDGLPEDFHVRALRICERMGGFEGDLIVRNSGSGDINTPS